MGVPGEVEVRDRDCDGLDTCDGETVEEAVLVLDSVDALEPLWVEVGEELSDRVAEVVGEKL